MIEIMKVFTLHLLFIVVISFGSFGLANSTPLEPKDSGKSIASSISTENKELHQQLKEGCEIDAYIKEEDSNCEIKIIIKEDFAQPIFPNFPEIEKAINVELVKGCFPENSSCDINTLHDGAILVYIKYKKESKISRVRLWNTQCRRATRLDLDEKLIEHGFTYAEIFRVVEELLHRDKTKLGKESIFRKKIVFKKILIDQMIFLDGGRPAY